MPEEILTLNRDERDLPIFFFVSTTRYNATDRELSGIYPGDASLLIGSKYYFTLYERLSKRHFAKKKRQFIPGPQGFKKQAQASSSAASLRFLALFIRKMEFWQGLAGGIVKGCNREFITRRYLQIACRANAFAGEVFLRLVVADSSGTFTWFASVSASGAVGPAGQSGHS
jgi:hypothetical protein